MHMYILAKHEKLTIFSFCHFAKATQKGMAKEVESSGRNLMPYLFYFHLEESLSETRVKDGKKRTE